MEAEAARPRNGCFCASALGTLTLFEIETRGGALLALAYRSGHLCGRDGHAHLPTAQPQWVGNRCLQEDVCQFGASTQRDKVPLVAHSRAASIERALAIWPSDACVPDASWLVVL